MANKVWIGGSTAGANSVNVAANWSPSGCAKRLRQYLFHSPKHLKLSARSRNACGGHWRVAYKARLSAKYWLIDWTELF